MKAKTHDSLKEIHNRYLGERLFVFGTGPSLLGMDQKLLFKLGDEFTFATNKLFKWRDMPFNPQFHALSEAEDMPHLFEYAKTTYQFACHWGPIKQTGWTWVPKAEDGVCIWTHGMQGLGDTLSPLPSGASTPITAGVQLGAWMGFDPIYLLGCDNSGMGQVFDVNETRGTIHPMRTRESAQRCYQDMKAAGRELIDLTPTKGLVLSSWMTLEKAIG